MDIIIIAQDDRQGLNEITGFWSLIQNTCGQMYYKIQNIFRFKKSNMVHMQYITWQPPRGLGQQGLIKCVNIYAAKYVNTTPNRTTKHYKQLNFSTRYSVISYMGNESEKEWIHIHVWLDHFAVHLKLTQHRKSTILQYKIKIKLKK